MLIIMNFVVFMGIVSSIEKRLLVDGLNATYTSSNESLFNYVIGKVNIFLTASVFPLMAKKAPPNKYRNTVELIERMGLIAEKHNITTPDGYIIEIHRIKSLEDSISSEYPPILLQHGLLDTSSNWVMNPCNQSLGYILSSTGFDVWISNIRGNLYGRRHHKLSPESPEFWDYSLDEIAQRDLPAAIDYVLKVTNRSQINYIAHSMGTTLAFILLATQPQYNQKIKTFYALSPIAYTRHLKSPVAKALIFFFGPQATFWSTLGSNGMFPSEQMKRLFEILCSLNVQLCADLLGQISGPNLKEINMRRVPTFFHYLAGTTSFKTLIHFVQMHYSNLFCQFDLGYYGNYLAYHQATPTEYELKNINVSTVFLCGLNDYLSDIEDVKFLSQRLTNHNETIIIDDLDWSHMDFMTAKNARKVIYQLLTNKILEGK